MPNPKVRTLTIGGVTYDLQDNISGYITGITSSDVTTALGFTPYNATNPNGYTTNTGTITKVQTTAGAHTTINVSSGAATFNVPTKTSDLTNDGDGVSPFVTYSSMYGEGYITADDLAIPTFRAADATSKAVLRQAFGVDAEIMTPSSYTSQLLLLYDLEPRTWFCWMNGTEMEFARMSISVNTGTSVITLYLRGRTSIATGIMGVDSSWTVTPLASDAEGVAY